MLTAARLGAATLSAALLTGAAAAPALADTPSPTAAAAPEGLYGKGDPTYDGVWRQSLALTALAAAKVTPADQAVAWLAGQQCEDGGWPSYRAAGAACDAKTEDSNATAVAVQALVALGGHQDAVDKGVQWLKTVQNADGSWAFNPGNPGDANSTGLAVNALFAAKTDPAGVAKDGKNAFDGLARFQLGCAAPADQRGAFAFQPDAASGALAPNALATAQASLAAAGGRLPVAAGVRSDTAPKPPACQDGAAATPVAHADSAEAAGAYLTAQLGAGGNHLTLTMPGATPTPDYTATAWAALGLTQSGHPQQAAGAVDWLTQNGAAWTKGGTDAGAAATLLLVSQAAQRDTAALVQQLTALGPAPKATAPASAAATTAPAAEKKKDGGIGQYWLIGIGLLIGIGGGLILSLQRKRAPKL
ncbi:terpene cyclase/mutase family protein [Streptomyces sp. SP17BM10]|uniref:prenyltransferase/squalene oxidase repeat-containing protein n=1 Tax=Streptomyces sp. SP17BM10 TaxID=3002530 RepID=UPI002E76D4CB|nr:prenyltransferase/squalene oxidase repeat-containing protein [Streptomyces sp. SP17BM10]MEE1787792.1 terpene cyclase/mutase family protein [Streptomyces sp. SP17BM10]